MTDVSTALQSAFKTGTMAAISMSDLVNEGGYLGTEDWLVDVEVELDDTCTWNCGNLFSALGASAHDVLGAVPASLSASLPVLSDTFTLSHAGFLILPATGSLASITLTGELSASKAAYTINGITITVQAIVLTVDQPLSANRTVSLIAQGQVSTGQGPVDNLGFTLALPELTLSLGLINDLEGVDVTALLASVDVSTDLFDAFVLDELSFDMDLRNKSIAAQINLQRDAMASASDAATGFALDDIAFQAIVSGDVRSASLLGQCSYTSASDRLDSEPLLFTVSASYDSDSKWSLVGSCTAQANTAVAPQGRLSLSRLLNALDLDVNADTLPLGLGSIELDELRLEADLGPSCSYMLDATFQAQITLSDKLPLDVWASIDLQRRPSAASETDTSSTYKTSGSLGLTLDIDGFTLLAEFDFGQQGELFTVSTTIGAFALSGTFDPAKDTIEVDITQPNGFSIGALLAEVIGLITGNRQHQLSSPFALLNDIHLTELSLAANIRKKTLDFTIDIAPVSIIPDMLSVTGITFGYASSTANGGSGFSVALDYELFGSKCDPLSFDPTGATAKPVQPAGVPEFELFAALAGQHASVTGDADSVSAALLKAVGYLKPAQPQSSPLQLPTFEKDGWVLGADMLIKQQIRLGIIFDDPQFYGASLKIVPAASGAPTSAYLSALVGLDAEISYHKIDDTLGVYSASLTLPKATTPGAPGSITLPLCTVQLPSLSLKLYTDSDFLVDIGFPYSLDFSNSLSVQVEEYVGSGGVFFGKLSGAEAPALADRPEGIVGTVIELGVGMQIGIHYAASCGPLSGSVSVTAQGLFEGIFAEITPKSSGGKPPSNIEYYDITAALSISGMLSAEVNFFIVSASLYVAIDVYAQVAAIYDQEVTAYISASVDVRLKAEINLGFFSISKTFSFSAHVSDTVQLGHGGRLLLPEQPAHFALGAAPIARYFRDCPLTSEITVWLTPVLTLCATGSWAYVLDFAVPTDVALVRQDGAFPVEHSPFYDLLQLVLGWFVYAYKASQGELPPVSNFDSLLLDAAELHVLDGILASMGNSDTPGFDLDDLSHLVKTSLRLNLEKIPAALAGKTLSVAAFPLLPQTQWAFNQNAYETSDQAQKLARDYFVMLAHAAIGYARTMLESSAHTAPLSLRELMRRLDTAKPTSYVQQAAGLATRFMMHANQTGPKGKRVSAYLDAGIEQPFQFNDIKTIAFKVTPTNGNTLQISSEDPHSVLYAPSAISKFGNSPAFHALSWRLLPATDVLPRTFVSRSSTALADPKGSATGSLWRLPKELIAQLQKSGATVGFAIGAAADPHFISPEKLTRLDHSRYAFATVIDLVLQRDPTAAAGANYYGIHSIRGRSRARLTDLAALLAGGNPPVISKAEIAFPTAIGTTGTPTAMGIVAADASVFVYVENFSSQAFPQDQRDRATASNRATTPIGPAAQMVFALQARALTNRGGYSLVIGALDGGLPDAAFNTEGLATISLVLSFAPQADGTDTLAAHHSALRLDAAASGHDHLAIWTPEFTRTRRNFSPGVIGLELTVDYANPSDDSQYVQTLNRLFHLIGLTPAVKAAWLPPIDHRDSPLITSPLDDSEPRRYQRTLNVFEQNGKQPSPYVRLRGDTSPFVVDPKEATDPYALVGASVDISQSFVLDTFGNALSLPAALTKALKPITVMWTDDLLGIDQWPGMTTRYDLQTSADGPALSLLLDWNPPAGKPEPATQKRLVQRYTDIYFQLGRIDATLTSSLLPGVSWPLPRGVDLASWLQEQIATLLSFIAENASFNASKTFAVPPRAQFNTAILFPLSVELSFALKPGIPVENGSSADFSVTAALFPNLWQQLSNATDAAPTWRSSSLAFAKSLETAFTTSAYALDYRLMSGQVEEDGDPTYWLLRYGPAALNLALDTPAEFSDTAAPRPLITQPVERIPPPPSVTSKALPSGPMDVDESMRSFMDIFDNIMRPATALGMERMLPGTIGTQQAAKIRLAAGLANNVLDVSSGKPAHPAAVEAYRQAMLKNTGSYYAMDGVVTYEVNARAGTAPFNEPLAIYGNLSVPDAKSAHANFAPASALFNVGGAPGSSALAFGFSAHDATAERTVTTPATFVLKAIRTKLSPTTAPPASLPDTGIGFAAYLSGVWLHFVNTPPVIAVAPRTLSVPIRALPAAPTPISQSFAPAARPTESATLQALKGWTMEGVLRRRPIAQDVLSVLLDANVPPTVPSSLTDGTPDIARCLMDFEYAWADVGAGLGAGIATAPRSPGLVDNVATFATMTSALALAAGTPLPAPPWPLPASATAAYLVTEAADADGADAGWSVTVQIDRPRCALAAPGPLSVGLAGYQATVHGSGEQYVYTYQRAGEPLLIGDALAITERSMAVSDTFDIIGAQTGRLSYATLRNTTLSAPFQYATPAVTLPRPILPHVEQAACFDLSTLAGTGVAQPLGTYLSAYLVALLSTDISGAAASLKLQMTLEIAYPSLVGNVQMPFVARPILLLPATDFPVNAAPRDVAKVVADLSVGVAAWQKPLGAYDSTKAPFKDLYLRVRTIAYTQWQDSATTPLMSLQGAMIPLSAVKTLSA